MTNSKFKWITPWSRIILSISKRQDLEPLLDYGMYSHTYQPPIQHLNTWLTQRRYNCSRPADGTPMTKHAHQTRRACLTGKETSSTSNTASNSSCHKLRNMQPLLLPVNFTACRSGSWNLDICRSSRWWETKASFCTFPTRGRPGVHIIVQYLADPGRFPSLWLLSR